MPVTKKRPLVVLTDYSYETIQPFIDVYKAADFEFRPCQCKSPEEIIEACKDADAIQVHFAEITRDILAALPKCRLLVHSGVGMDTIDVDAARDLGIPACNVPDYGIEDVATHTILLMLAVTKKLNKLMDTVKRGVWDFSVAKPVHRLAGRTFGTIGCGAIARSTIQKAQAFGMNVISYDPFLTQEQVAPLGITLKSMDEVAAESDVISLHLHLNKSTEGMIGADFFRKMKKDAFFINTARGAIVKEDELIAALRDGEIAGRIFDGVAQDIVEYPAQRGRVQRANVFFLRNPDLRNDSAGGQRAVKAGDALFQHVVYADRRAIQRVRRRGNHGIAKQLLRKAAHGVRALAEDGEIARGVLRLRLTLQQLQIAANRRKRRAQVVGNAGYGVCQLAVSGLQPQALPAKRLKLPIDLRCQRANGPVAGGNGDQRVRVRLQLFAQRVRNLANRAPQNEQIAQRNEQPQREQADCNSPFKSLLISNPCAPARAGRSRSPAQRSPRRTA